MQNLIAIQDRYIARVARCQTGHVRRVKRAARADAVKALVALGFTDEQAQAAVNDARDMADLERIAE